MIIRFHLIRSAWLAACLLITCYYCVAFDLADLLEPATIVSLPLLMNELHDETNSVIGSRGVNVTLSAARNFYLKRGRSAKITVQIENLSDKDLELNTAFVITLSKESDDKVERRRNSFSSPIRIMNHLSQKCSKCRDGKLVTGGKLEAEIDLTKLKWERSISAVWPDRELFEAVPGGSYKLYFEVKIHDQSNKGVVWSVKSNEISTFVRH